MVQNPKLPRFATIEKLVGETPLIATERLRANLQIPKEVPLAYAGRLDPMASGKLLVLIGDECKVQEKYHTFDKEYTVEILFGVRSDSGDVLGILSSCKHPLQTVGSIKKVLTECTGQMSLPYPHFSSKTVQGKSLHTWTLENRLHEIEIPVKKSKIYKLNFNSLRTISKEELLKTVRAKIETIPEVTDERKALGADFRRKEVRETWNAVASGTEISYQILSYTCIASSGTYMRSLSEHIAESLGTCGLSYAIHRNKIGNYKPFGKKLGLWTTQF